MNKKTVSIIFLSLFGIGIGISVPATNAIGNREFIHGDYLTDINRCLKSKKALSCSLYVGNSIERTRYSYDDSDCVLKNYLSTLEWEECAYSYVLNEPKRDVAGDQVYICYPEAYITIAEYNHFISVRASDSTNILDNWKYYKFNPDSFESIRNIILEKGEQYA